MLSSVSCLVLLQGIFLLWRSISRHISATKWHGSLCCYIWDYEHPASKKPCPIFDYGDVGVFIKIYETVKKLRYLISYCFAPFGVFSIPYYTHMVVTTQEKCAKTVAWFFFYPQLYSIIKFIVSTPPRRAAKTEGHYDGKRENSGCR